MTERCGSVARLVCEYPYECNNYRNFTCPFPYTGYECGETYAEAIGIDYLLFHIFFTTFATIAFLTSAIQMARLLWYDPHWDRKSSFKKRFLIVLVIMSAMMFIQGIDPMAYNGVLPLGLDTFLSNATTTCGLTLVVFLIFNLIKTVNMMKPPEWYKWVFGFLIFVAFVLTIVFSVLQTTESRHTFRGIKLICYSAALTLVSGMLAYWIHNVLKRFRRWDGTGSTASLHLEYRMKFFFSLYSIFITHVIITQLITGIHSLNSTDYIAVGISFDQIYFPSCQFIGIAFGLGFTNRIAEYNSTQPMTLTNISKKIKKTISKRLGRKEPDDDDGPIDFKVPIPSGSKSTPGVTDGMPKTGSV